MIVDMLEPVGKMFIIHIRHPDKKIKQYVSWAILEYVFNDNAPDEIKVWDIHTRPQYRKKGYAGEIVKFLKTQPDVKVWTNYERITDDGAKLFLHNGFTIYKSLNKNECDKLVWMSNEKSE